MAAPTEIEKSGARRVRCFVFALVAAFLLLIAGLVWHSWSSSEPRYRGQYLSTWLEEAAYSEQVNNSPTNVQQHEAEAAIRALGPQSAQFCVALLKYRETPSAFRGYVDPWLEKYPALGDRIEPWLPDASRPPFHFSDEGVRPLAELAYNGFAILGPLGESAAPELLSLLDNTNTGAVAASCLHEIGRAAIPALTNALLSPQTLKRTYAVIALGKFSAEAPQLAPVFAGLVHDPERSVYGPAIQYLGEMGGAAQAFVPLLEQSLLDKKYSEFAAIALSKLGYREPLLDAFTNSEPEIRVAAAVGLDTYVQIAEPDYAPYGSVLLLTEQDADWWFRRETQIEATPFVTQHLQQILLDNLKDSQPRVRALAATRIGEYGIKAWPAIPALSKASSDTNETVRQSALNALAAIDLQFSEGGIIRGPRGEKKIALVFTAHTFAEGGEIILNELARHRGHASFFLTGNFLDSTEFQPLITRIIKEGHYLGPHSDQHLLYCPWDGSKHTLVSRKDFFADLMRNNHKVLEHQNAALSVNPPPNTASLFYRMQPMSPTEDLPRRPGFWLPAYEWYNQEIVDWSRELNLALINYTPGTRSNADYTQESDKNFVSSQAIYDSIISKEKEDPHGLNGFFLLLHLGVGPGRADKFSTHHFRELLDYLAGRGYQFVSVDELLNPR